MLTIRRYQPEDWPQFWSILRATIELGDTFAFAPHSSQTEVFKAWIETPGAAAYVATTANGIILGGYKIQANQVGLGSHVSNGSYVVAPQARGQGIASAMCEHSQAQALAMGFKAMQFNLVVATNEVAVRLWQKHGFAIVGTLPGAFLHRMHGYVDAYVMFKKLNA